MRLIRVPDSLHVKGLFSIQGKNFRADVTRSEVLRILGWLSRSASEPTLELNAYNKLTLAKNQSGNVLFILVYTSPLPIFALWASLTPEEVWMFMRSCYDGVERG